MTPLETVTAWTLGPIVFVVVLFGLLIVLFPPPFPLRKTKVLVECYRDETHDPYRRISVGWKTMKTRGRARGMIEVKRPHTLPRGGWEWIAKDEHVKEIY